MLSRRFFCGAGIAVAAGAVAKSALAALPEIVSTNSPDMQPPLISPNGPPYRAVATLNGWSLPWRMRNGVKEFHLVAEPVIREVAPGMQAYLWGYNGQSPGPTIEVVEGDRVRMFVTNRLAEPTSIHWHGQRLPNGMDGVVGLNQPSIKPGQTYVYGHEFVVVGTDGGWTSPGSRWPEVTTDIAVGQMRAIEFTAAAPGDWAFHCHKSHHTMNAMSHVVPNSIGVEQGDLARQIAALVPGYMDIGAAMSGMQMNMPLPANTLPMMTGAGRYGDIEMGGMFTVVKIRADLAHGDYRDPGWYHAPAGSVAYAWEGDPPPALLAP